MKKIREGAIVSIEGSNTLWRVVEVRKNLLDVVDEAMGIIELEDIETSEVIDVIRYD